MRDYKQDVFDITGRSYITDIPIEEFENLEDLENFVKVMDANGIGVVMCHEQSNYHQGVLIQAYDKETCTTKECLL